MRLFRNAFGLSIRNVIYEQSSLLIKEYCKQVEYRNKVFVFSGCGRVYIMVQWTMVNINNNNH